MKLNLDDLLEITHPWDFAITVGGVDYATRRPSLGELDGLLKMAQIPRGKLWALAQSLFVDPAPDVSQWGDRKLLAFFAGYLAYFKQRTDTEKKLDPVAQAIATVEAVLARQQHPKAPPQASPAD